LAGAREGALENVVTGNDAAGAGVRASAATPRFMSVKQVAAYLQINEKKVYAMVGDGKIPASKVTGKWLFPKDLVDQWVLESCHGGLLTDRMLIAGSDDALLYRAIIRTANAFQASALISFTPTVTQLGLKLLARRRADLCGLSWGPAEESHQRHPALIRQYPQHHDWLLVRLFRREQGLIMTPGAWTSDASIARLFSKETRWVAHQQGAGSHRFLQELASRYDLDPASRRIASHAYSERDAASLIAMGHADVTIGVRASATEYGLDFLSVGWEAFDLAMHRGIFFRSLFQSLLENIRGNDCQSYARMLGGYDLSEAGNLVWPD
jgi:excisionase family DNA binding protein